MRTRKAALNFVSSLLRNFTGMLLGMVSTPIILSYLGEEKFGIMRVLLDWFSHLTLVEFGLYAAVMSFMVKVLGEKKNGLGSALKATFLKYCTVLGLQILVIGLFCLFFEKLVPVSPQYQRETWISFFVLGSSIFFIFSQVFKAHLEASQRGYIVNYVMIFQNIFYIGISILFLFQGWSLIGQMAAYVLSIAIAFLLYVWVSRHEFKMARMSKEKFVTDSAFSRQRGSLFVSELSTRISLMSDNLMITFVLGTKEVTAFFLTQRLIQIVQTQLQSVSGAAWPALGELYYQNKMDVFRSRVLQLTELVAFLSGVSLSLLVLFNPAFIHLWTGESTFAGLWVSNLAAVNAGFFALMSLWNWCFAATNKSDRMVKVFVGQAIVNVTLSYWITSRWGVIGPLLAAFIGYAGLAIWWSSLMLARTFQISLWSLHRLWLGPFVIPMAVTAGGLAWFGYPVVESWWALAVMGASSGLVIFGVCYQLLISRETKAFLVQKIKSSKYFKK